MLTAPQMNRLKQLMGSAWGFYNGEQFPEEARFNLTELTVSTDAELLSLASAMLADACAVGGVLAAGDADKLTIGPITIQDTSPGDKQLAALAKLWCATSARLAKEAARAGTGTGGVRRLAPIRAGGKTGARPEPVFYLPKVQTGLDCADTFPADPMRRSP